MPHPAAIHDNLTRTETPPEKVKRRSSRQIEKDEIAILDIARIVQRADRFSLANLRQAVDEIGDVLVVAGRL